MESVKEQIRRQGPRAIPGQYMAIPGQYMAIVKDKIQGEIMDVIDDQVSIMIYYELRWKIVPTP